MWFYLREGHRCVDFLFLWSKNERGNQFACIRTERSNDKWKIKHCRENSKIQYITVITYWYTTRVFNLSVGTAFQINITHNSKRSKTTGGLIYLIYYRTISTNLVLVYIVLLLICLPYNNGSHDSLDQPNVWVHQPLDQKIQWPKYNV